jgi:NADH-quinone oxidoreductase subunit F
MKRLPGSGWVNIGLPTTVNNVETLAVAPAILRRAGQLVLGALTDQPKNSGAKVFCISGHVNKPCNVEEELGIPLRRVGRHLCRWRTRQVGQSAAIIPGGSSVPLLPAYATPMLMDFDSLRDVKSGRHGCGDRDGQVHRCHSRHRQLSQFYKHESCGQCTPCREGTGWMMRVMNRMVQGRAELDGCHIGTGVPADRGHTICALGGAARWPVRG